jgi:predicted transcriptional regulator of viral defense system
MSTITAEQAEKLLGIKPATLRKWVERGHVRRLRHGVYDLDDVRARWLLLDVPDEAEQSDPSPTC